jgi:hypothetical protein
VNIIVYNNANRVANFGIMKMIVVLKDHGCEFIQKL